VRPSEILALAGLILLSVGVLLLPVLLLRRKRRSGRRGGFAPQVAQAVQAVLRSHVIAQVGVVAHITVEAIGYLKAQLKPSAGARMLAPAEGGAPRLSVGARYALEVQHALAPPASYRGAAVRLETPRPETLQIVITGEGFEVSDGGASHLEIQPAGIAQTKFEVRPAQEGPLSLRVDCYRGNGWLQSLDLRFEARPAAEVESRPRDEAIGAVETSSTLAAPPAEPARRDLQLHVFPVRNPERSETFRVRLRTGPDGPSREIDTTLREHDLRELNQGLREALEKLWRTLGNTIALSPEERSAPELLAALDLLARRGNAVFNRLFRAAADRDAVRAALAGDHDSGLEIATDSFFVPWELLHDSYAPGQPVDAAGFWGFRYDLSRRLTDVGQTPPPLIPFELRPRVLLFADPGLDSVSAIEIPYLRSLDSAERIALCEWRQEGETLPEEERRAHFFTDSASQPSEVTHFACHAVAAEYGPDSCLELDETLRITIEDMTVGTGYRLAGSPLVVLNACGTGIRDPLETSNFIRGFLEGGARGVLATECDVPDAFASAFIPAFYERLLAGATVTKALLATRRAFLREQGNPLGLLYAAYMPLETKLVRRAPGQTPG
jgi:CHAT domain